MAFLIPAGIDIAEAAIAGGAMAEGAAGAATAAEAAGAATAAEGAGAVSNFTNAANLARGEQVMQSRSFYPGGAASRAAMEANSATRGASTAAPDAVAKRGFASRVKGVLTGNVAKLTAADTGGRVIDNGVNGAIQAANAPVSGTSNEQNNAAASRTANFGMGRSN
ncbi:hypothetical protein UFOVP115_76 [uncultured Caudovirales phage]|uniref:Uncharacterized protein n=1 Tax=uncultured Caudovirales phage TaxID=2100421 RepID=A0A6J5L5G6_9CAUD|nr:hypothetical protein UFOVP115_76 [uncultured Caudovirales phage]